MVKLKDKLMFNKGKGHSWCGPHFNSLSKFILKRHLSLIINRRISIMR